jgi:hypothetical protein
MPQHTTQREETQEREKGGGHCCCVGSTKKTCHCVQCPLRHSKLARSTSFILKHTRLHNHPNFISGHRSLPLQRQRNFYRLHRYRYRGIKMLEIIVLLTLCYSNGTYAFVTTVRYRKTISIPLLLKRLKRIFLAATFFAQNSR